ncbi:MAG: hypothetical protein NT069_04955 [Planctomycetota bacterium]|nr:hypothetical protein [Planctomycetota bacterium]
MAKRDDDNSLEFDRGSLGKKNRTKADRSSRSPVVKVLLAIFGVIGLVCAGCGGFFVYNVYQGVQQARDRAARGEPLASPGESNFHDANSKISVNRGQVAFGNTPAAKELAEQFSQNVRAMRELYFTKRKKKATFSTSDGQFLTYCQLTDGACVFLVHIPDLRKFTDDAKESLSEIAWEAAQRAVRNGVETPPPQIAIATRGVILYDRILIGRFQTGDDEDETGVEYRGKGSDGVSKLYPFFANFAEGEIPSAAEWPAVEPPAMEGESSEE